MATLRLFHDIMFYSAGSLIIGLLLTIGIVVLLFVLIKSFFPNSAFSPVSIIAGIVLTFFLSFKMVTMCGAISLKWMCDDFEQFISNSMPQELIDADIPLSESDTDALIEKAIEEYPIFASYVYSGTFTGFTSGNIAHTMAETLDEFLTQFIVESILWSLLYMVIAGVIVIWSLKRMWDSRLKTSSRNQYVSGNPRRGYGTKRHARSMRYRR